MQRLGDILVARGAIAREELERHLPRLHGRIGAALRAHTLIRARPLAEALAEQYHLPFVTLHEAHCAPHLFVPRHLKHYLQHRYLPYQMHTDRLQIVTPDPSPALHTALEDFYQIPIELLVISTRDFTSSIALQGSSTLTRRATLALRSNYKYLVADRVLERPQMWGLGTLLTFTTLAFLLVPNESWRVTIILANLFYLATLAFKLQLFTHGRAKQKTMPHLLQQLDAAIAKTDDAQWPHYSILVPLYREQFGTLARLISHLDALDYPKEKLDIKLICEADDTDTITTLKSCNPPETMEIITVAPSYPRTKPKACNVALPQIRGEYLVIFDAEDAPEPRQMKRAAVMFALEPKETACLQVPLNYYNRNENMLTRLFSIEYSALFRLTLPAMQRLSLPIPLGGTSNHLRVAALNDIGGWDAFNVTEDADLGIRFAYFGYRTRLLPSRTLEEAPITIRAWLKQRSRWVKGYIQTWLVFMRDPAELRQRLGSRGYYGFQFFIGAPALTFLMAPFFWVACIANALGVIAMDLPDALWGLCTVSFIGGLAVQLLYARSVVRMEGWRYMGWATLFYPFYWLLHSVASIRAIWQLATSPHQWEKTKHGVSRVFG